MLETLSTEITETKSQSLRLPPHSLQAEQSVLGGLMLDNQSWDKVADKLIAEDFYRREHRLIYTALAALAEENQPLDVVTLAEELERRKELEEVGGLLYLGNLVNDTPSAANILAYARIIHEHAIVRHLISIGTEIADSGYNSEGRKSAELLDDAERLVFEIAEKRQRGTGGFQSSKELATKAVDRITEMYDADEPVTGLRTGFTDFDEKTSGLQKGDLIIVAGRPSMGKTSFAMNMAEHAAISVGKPVAVFSMEMPGEQLAMRMLSSLGRIDQHRIRSGKLMDEEWPRLTSAVNILSKSPIYVDDTPALTPTDLRARARRLKRECRGELGMIMVDYMQLMQVPGMSDNRTNEISAISRALKGLAMELNVPVVALSQLNRSLEQRANKRPIMSDLRESGAIEQDADLIVFIYRDEVYRDKEDEEILEEERGKAEIIIGKQRNGPIGTVLMTFLGKYTKFENFMPLSDYSDYSPAPDQ